MKDFELIEIPCKVHRLINSSYPPIGVFDTLCDSADELKVLFELEMASNPRNNILTGRLALIPDGEIVIGDDANIVMAAFVHSNDDGGRFNDGRLGAWYASFDIKTSIEETVYHYTKRLSFSEGGFPQEIQMRQLITTVNEPLLNICGSKETHPELYHIDDYTGSQKFAHSVKWPFVGEGISGIKFDSVRTDGGVNVCVFRPSALDRPVTQGAHYQYNWDDTGKVSVVKLSPVKRSAG